MKQIYRHIKKYFTIWWIPMVTNLFAIGIFFLGTLFQHDWIIDLFLFVFLMNIIGTLVSSVVQLVKSRWYFIIPQLGLTIFLFYYVGLIFTYSPPDYYGVGKEIPENMDFSNPLYSFPSDQEWEKYDFILVNDFQPGLYLYETDHKPYESGYFYVKAFEINTNDLLSGERMKIRSKILVNDLEQKKWEGRFTIYEGDWGDKYGSRMELWYQPINGQEYMVEERNFIIEGWQR